MSARAAPRRRVAWRSDAASSSSSSQLPLPPLLALPHDCQAVVLGALPPRALALLCATCHSLRSAADDPKLWAPHCLVQWPDDDGPPSRLRFGSRHRLFARLTVCSTHLEPAARAAARTAVVEMGGCWEDALSTAATHLVCGATFTAKARLARPHARLVTPEWLWATVRAARRQREADFRPPLLHGARVSASGLPPELRPKVQTVVRRHGGEFTAALHHPFGEGSAAARGTTHLLVVSRASASKEKLEAAERWGVPVLSLRWLSDSVARGRCGDPGRYVV